MEIVLGLLIALGALALFFGLMRASETRQHHLPQEGVFVERPPREALEMLTANLVAEGYAVTHRSDYTATLTRRKNPEKTTLIWFVVASVLLFPIGLMVFGIYLLYYAAAKPRVTASIVASGDGTGTRLMLSGDDRMVRKDLKQWAS